MNIYIPIEVKARELEGRSLLAFEAASRGHHVIIGGKEDTLALAENGILKPGIVYNKSITIGQLESLMKIKANGHINTSQDEEHGLLDKNYNIFIKRRFPADTIELADKLYCWGSFDYESLSSHFKDAKHKFVITGSPRVDLWRSELNAFFEQPPIKNYVLIASNFGSSLNMWRYWQLYQVKKRWSGNNEPDQRLLFESWAYQLRLLGEFVTMIKTLAVAVPDIQFVVRPHPVENIEGWSSFLDNAPQNVHVLREGSISGWIRNAIAVVHNGCTSALESCVSKVPVIAYRPLPSSYEREVPNMLGAEAFSPDELKMYLNNILNKKADNKQHNFNRNYHLVEERLASLQGEFAFRKIVDDWESFDCERLNQSNKEFIETRLLNEEKKSIVPKKGIKTKIVSALKFYLCKGNVTPKLSANSASNTVSFKHKFSGLSMNEMLELKTRYSQILEHYECVQIKKIGERTYYLYK